MRNASVLTALWVFLSASMALGLDGENPLAGSDEKAPEGAAAPFLGVRLLEVSPELAAHLGVSGGALVADVLPESPAAKAGLKKHDVIREALGAAIEKPEDLEAAIHSKTPGDTVALTVLRGAKELRLEAKLGSREAPAPIPAPAPAPEKPEKPEKQPGFLGVQFGPLSQELRDHLGLEEGLGVSVVRVLEASPAEKAGIKTHDIILRVAGTPVRLPEDLPRLLSAHRAGDEVEIEWMHRGAEQHQKVALGVRPEGPGFQGEEWLQPRFEGDGGRARPGWPNDALPPRHFFRGKIYWKDGEGKEHTFELPEFGVPDPQKTWEGWKDSFRKHFDDLPREFHQRLDKLLEKGGFQFRGEFGPGAPSAGGTSATRVAVSRLVEGGYDVTVKDENGRRSVTVKKDGAPVAENLPADKIDTLPADVRERVQRALDSLPKHAPEDPFELHGPGSQPLPRPSSGKSLKI
jgi:membrane-associated protease RseP (regulator of RpoE activity)